MPGKLVQINPVIRLTTSTGRIMKEIAGVATEAGWQCRTAYSRGRDGVPSGVEGLMPVGSRLSVAWHGLLTRLLDRHGLGSAIATRRFVRELEKFDPDVVHIHNIHGYFLNYEILFDYLRRSGKPVIWTVHDCWLFTGHCFHYASAGCGKWRGGCGNCPQKRAFPTSWLLDRSASNWDRKKAAFTSLGSRLTLVTVSEWMKSEVAESFLGGCRIEVIHNGIDLGVFKPCSAPAKGKALILGVASIWCREKGLDDFVKMDSLLDHDREEILLVGVKESQKAALPPTIKTLARTADAAALAQLYSRACALANPTWQDNYPTVNMEAIACGTPVVTYRTGGSVETITPQTGEVVEQGDVAGMLAAIRRIAEKGKDSYTEGCRQFALERFGKEDRYKDYLKLYEDSSVR